jgi:hypothetical protein
MKYPDLSMLYDGFFSNEYGKNGKNDLAYDKCTIIKQLHVTHRYFSIILA